MMSNLTLSSKKMALVCSILKVRIKNWRTSVLHESSGWINWQKRNFTF